MRRTITILALIITALALPQVSTTATTTPDMTKTPKLALVSSSSTPTGTGTGTVSVTTSLRWNTVPKISGQLVCVLHVNCWGVGTDTTRYTLTVEATPGTTVTYWVVTCWPGRSECANSNTVSVTV